MVGFLFVGLFFVVVVQIVITRHREYHDEAETEVSVCREGRVSLLGETCPGPAVCRAVCGYSLLHRDNKLRWRRAKTAKGTRIPMLMWRLSQIKAGKGGKCA